MSTALQVLLANQGSIPEEMNGAIAEIMIPNEVEDGHIFVKEGDDIANIVFVESGKLIRSKMSVPDEEKEGILKLGIEEIKKKSIVIDEVLPGTRSTGVLHNFEPGSTAFATIYSSGPTKVWSIPGERFRAVVAKPEFNLIVMAAMAKQIRKNITLFRENLRIIDRDTSEDEKAIRILSYDSTGWVVDNFNVAIEKFNKENDFKIIIEYTTERLSSKSASLAADFDVVCLFVNDSADAETIKILSKNGIKMIANRSAGFDRVDTKAALAYGVSLARVPAYSPYAVAEFAITLLMSVNRKIIRATSRVKMANFSLDSGLIGTDIHGKTVGVMGTGKIGQILCRIIKGFGANLICYDVFESDAIKEMGGKYVTKEEIFAQSDILFLMMPLLTPTKYTINDNMLNKLKPGVILINSSRGGLVDTKSVLKGIHEGIISGYGADVYEHESEYFFQDYSAKIVTDPILSALLAENRVLLTPHYAFFTQEAINGIVNTTLENVKFLNEGKTMYEHPNNFLPVRLEAPK
mmetsp:Transcript_4264/g.4809  ORF Transcript_4264/g.4809 Transcript_4264/m.4809 type:complete len:521 (-) Transcript_4264:206-1768(-)